MKLNKLVINAWRIYLAVVPVVILCAATRFAPPTAAKCECCGIFVVLKRRDQPSPFPATTLQLLGQQMVSDETIVLISKTCEHCVVFFLPQCGRECAAQDLQAELKKGKKSIIAHPGSIHRYRASRNGYQQRRASTYDKSI